MELYDILTNEWSVLEEKLPLRLSNHACFSPDDDKVIIIGGGSSDGYFSDILSFELSKRQLTTIGKMNTGRDLRNKIVCHNDEVFTIGGYKTCTAEKFNLRTKRWAPVKQYSMLVKDMLDSWYCTLIHENPLKSTNSNGTMFRICDILPASDNRPSYSFPYEEENLYEDHSEELEPMAYEPGNIGMGRYPVSLDYEEEATFQDLSYDEEDATFTTNGST